MILAAFALNVSQTHALSVDIREPPGDHTLIGALQLGVTVRGSHLDGWAPNVRQQAVDVGVFGGGQALKRILQVSLGIEAVDLRTRDQAHHACSAQATAL